MDDVEVGRLLATTSVLWPNFHLPTTAEVLDQTIDAWRAMLHDIAPDAASAALRSLSAEGKEFPPTVGQVRKRAIELVGLTTATALPTKGEAWEESRRLIARLGWMRQPSEDDCSHPAIYAAINAMGWQSLCESTNEVADRAHFMAIYEQRASCFSDHMRVTVPQSALPSPEPLPLPEGRP